jgi:peptidoglycan lytic transglycosylase G
VSDIDFSDGAASPRRGPRPGCLIGLVVLVLIAAAGVFAYHQGVDLLKRVLASPPDRICAKPADRATVITVNAGDTWTDAAKRLCHAGVITDYSGFIDAASGTDQSLQPGSYRLQPGLSAATALGVLSDPSSRMFTPVTIPEGYRATEILQAILAKTTFSKSAVHHAFTKLESSGLPAYAHGNAEGYLFPATYDVEPGTTPANLLKQMVTRFDQYAASAGLRSRASQLGYSASDVVNVASLVQAEARRTQDMAKVAAVIYNRLRLGMPLQLDSTVHYALDTRGNVGTSQHSRQIDSPYNTYQVTGLPPTPIDSPGADALDAALHPAGASYLYFVTVNLRTGQTMFATSYADHLRNVARYKRYCRSSDAC